MLLDRVGAETMDQREPARLVVRIQDRDQILYPLSRHPGADLDTDRIGNTAKILDMCAVRRSRAHTDPRKMRRQVVPALAAIQVTRLCLLVEQVQAFVAA